MWVRLHNKVLGRSWLRRVLTFRVSVRDNLLTFILRRNLSILVWRFYILGHLSMFLKVELFVCQCLDLSSIDKYNGRKLLNFIRYKKLWLSQRIQSSGLYTTRNRSFFDAKKMSTQRTSGISIFPTPDRWVVKAASEKILFPTPRTMRKKKDIPNASSTRRPNSVGNIRPN